VHGRIQKIENGFGRLVRWSLVVFIARSLAALRSHDVQLRGSVGDVSLNGAEEGERFEGM
jgi:hypothetical protein